MPLGMTFPLGSRPLERRLDALRDCLSRKSLMRQDGVQTTRAKPALLERDRMHSRARSRTNEQLTHDRVEPAHLEVVLDRDDESCLARGLQDGELVDRSERPHVDESDRATLAFENGAGFVG